MKPIAELLKRRRAALLAAAGLVAAAAIAAGAWLLLAGEGSNPPAEPQGAEDLGLALTPSAAGPEGVAADARFTLTSRVPLEASQVQASLAASPGVALEINQRSQEEFEVAPRQALEPGLVYRFTYTDATSGALRASWAFQVKSPLRVVQTLPADQAVDVPTDSGIELTFSHDGVADPQSLAEISPPLDGHWEQHGRTLVFVAGALAPRTLYTVTLKPGASVPGTDLKLVDAFRFSFETGTAARGAPPVTFDFLQKLGEAATKEPPLVSIYTNDSSLQQLPFDVFAYASADTFIADVQAREDIPYWARFTRDRKTADTSKLSPVLSFTASIEGPRQPNQGYYAAQSQLFIRFPQALAPGFYLVQTTYQGVPVQAWLQVTDIATYLAVSQTSTLVWVNDVSKGTAISGATVKLNGQTPLGGTDGQGILRFDTPKEMVAATTNQYDQTLETGKGYLTVADTNGRLAVVPVSPVVSPYLPGGRAGSFVESGFSYSGYDYWEYAISDRPIYQPDDTVRFWGVALPRDGGGEVPLTAELVGYANDGSGQVKNAHTVNLKTTDWGTFTGEFPLEGAEEGYSTINISGPNGYVTSVSFQVARYVKPAYKLEVTPSARAVFAGDTVDVGVTATFFDGTPLPGLRLRYSDKTGAPDGASQDLVTDAAGKAAFRLTATNKGPSGVAVVPISVAPSTPEEGEISAQAFVAVFPAALQISATNSYEAGQVKVSGSVVNVDPARMAPDDSPYYYMAGTGSTPSYVVGGAGGKTVTAHVSEQIWDAIAVGESYDFINKVSRQVYRYQQRAGANFDLSTVTGADGSFALGFPAREGVSYQVELSSVDDSGRKVTNTVYAYGSTATFDPGGMAYITTTDSSENSLFFTSKSVEAGDKTTAVFRRGKDETPSGGNNRYLFYEGQRGIRRYQVQDSPRYEVTFNDQQIPSIVIGGVYFNGFTYVEAQYGPTLNFNPKSRALKIEVKSLKESYQPGDEASVEVSVTDADGKPVQAEVNLSTVDEAVFAVSDFYSYQQDILRQLYRSLPSGIIRTYASHQYPPQFLEPGGRGGDGGGRQDFEDVADYETVRTDAAGKATVSFKLPDNLTSWRVTAYGFTKDLKAGWGSGPVVVSLPFSVDVSLNTDYLVGESPQVRLRAFGPALKDGDRVDFTVSGDAVGGGGEVKVSGSAFEDTPVALPPLTPGFHEMTFKAAGPGGSEDAVVRSFDVVDSRTAVAQLKLYDGVGSGTRFDQPSSRATVTLVDAGRGQYFQLLTGLRYAFGDRVDQALARVVAAKMLSDYFGDQTPAPALDVSPYVKAAPLPQPGQTPRKGGVAILPFSDPDLEVTARIANLAPDAFGRESLRRPLQAVVDDPQETPERKAIALYGLAGLGEPVLLEINGLASDPDLGWRGRLFAGLGLQALGDNAGASMMLDGLVRDYGEDAKPWYRLRVGQSQDDSLEATALAAVLAAGAGNPRAESMLRYVQENFTSEHLLYLDELQYLEGVLPRTAPEGAEFSYSADGETKSATLEKGRVLSLSLSPQDVKGLRVDVARGSLDAVVRSSVTLSAQQASPDLKVSRTLRAGGQTVTDTVPSSGVIEVTLQFSFGAQAPDGCYQVTDTVPSGLKVVTQAPYVQAFQPAPFYRPGVVFPYLADGQRISFCAGKSQSSVTYYVRPSAKGDFMWEPAVIQNMRSPGILAFSAPQKITVN